MISCIPDETPDTSPGLTPCSTDSPAIESSESNPAATSEVVAVIVHQLSTPITSLLVSAEILLNGLASLPRDETLAELRRIRRNTLWVQTLLENLKLSAKLSPLVPRWSKVCLDESLDDLLSLIRPVLDRRQQEVRMIGSPGSTYVWGDRQWVDQIFMNLLENASKYSGPESVIRVDANSEEQWIRVNVTDSGPGIPREEQEQIFRPYLRGAGAERSGVTGLGLGLHVVRSLVQAQGGVVGVDSRLGNGASFWFTLLRWCAGSPPPGSSLSPELP